MTTRVTRSALRTGSLLLASALLLIGGPAEARQKIQFLNDGRGVRDLPGTRTEQAAGPARTILVQGPLSFDRASGLRIDKLALRITSSTVVDGGSSAAALSRLAGRRATVFGQVRGKMLDARMVIVEPNEHSTRELTRAKKSQVRAVEDSGTGEKTGQLLEDAPR